MASTIISSPERPFSPPFHYDELTNEPYLPLPAPLGPRFRLTPPRISDTWPSSDEPNDIPTLVQLLNIPEINSFLVSPPFPFTTDHALERFLPRKEICEKALRSMEQVAASGDGVPEGCPVTFIRERLDDGTDILIGDCCLFRSRFRDIEDPEEQARATAINSAYEAGDPRIIYGISYLLAPTHQGRGIVSAAVSALINDWAIPFMRAKHFVSGAMSHNIPSQKVFLKNGFKFMKEMKDAVDMEAIGKSGGVVSLRVYDLLVGGDEPKQEAS